MRLSPHQRPSTGTGLIIGLGHSIVVVTLFLATDSVVLNAVCTYSKFDASSRSRSSATSLWSPPSLASRTVENGRLVNQQNSSSRIPSSLLIRTSQASLLSYQRLNISSCGTSNYLKRDQLGVATHSSSIPLCHQSRGRKFILNGRLLAAPQIAHLIDILGPSVQSHQTRCPHPKRATSPMMASSHRGCLIPADLLMLPPSRCSIRTVKSALVSILE